MLGNEKSRNGEIQADYAQQRDFCEVFEQEMDSLYLLAFLLTTNHEDAERCFVSTVDESFLQTSVFKDWARTWVKRCVIRTAVRIVSPTSGTVTGKREPWSVAHKNTGRDREIDAVTRLAPLERFVFVMAVLERYSTWDCSLLLGVSGNKVESAQLRALRTLPDKATFCLGTEARRTDRMQVVA